MLVIGGVTRVNNKIDIVKRYGPSVYIILQQQLKGDLQRTPDNKRIKYNAEPAPDIVLEPFFLQAARNKQTRDDKKQWHPETIKTHI